MKIGIDIISNTHKTYIIDEHDNSFTINGKKYNTDIDLAVFKITNLVSDWPKALEDKNVLDANLVRISIIDNTNKSKWVFKNKFPTDFYKLLNYLDEVENGY